MLDSNVPSPVILMRASKQTGVLKKRRVRQKGAPSVGVCPIFRKQMRAVKSVLDGFQPIPSLIGRFNGAPCQIQGSNEGEFAITSWDIPLLQPANKTLTIPKKGLHCPSSAISAGTLSPTDRCAPPSSPSLSRQPFPSLALPFHHRSCPNRV